MSLDWRDIFANPDTSVGASFEVPAWVGRLTRLSSPEATGFSTMSAEVFTLDDVEMSPGQYEAWSRQDGWSAFASRLVALAEVLGGSVDRETFEMRDGAQRLISSRHQVTYQGPKVEDL